MVDAITAGDAGAARAAMHAPLQGSHDRFAGTWPEVAALRPARTESLSPLTLKAAPP
ncbi:MAG: hypothetical protein H7242_16955 [Microbacteriaceae bacterium]|nr:hypothetical protein [Burkholderiaceae bacterium]